jgi:tellurite resistance protein TerC
VTLLAWIAFNAFVLFVLALDLGVFHRHAHVVRPREAAIWTAVWVSLALLFGAGVFWLRGPETGLEFYAGYLVEQALSVDNIFVFVLIFRYFRVPAEYQHRVLFWGIIGALLMRGAMIGAGAYLIHRFHWITWVFGAILIVTGIRMLTQKETSIQPEANPVFRLIERFVPVSWSYHGQALFIRRGARRVATLLFVVLVLVETTDLVFAVDSIPAVFAITRDPFVVYTSNVFAILGLRSLYFLLADVIERFHYLKVGLAFVLGFVGCKMLVAHWVKIPIPISLGVIAGVLAISVVASLVFPKPAAAEPAPPETGTDGPPSPPMERPPAEIESRPDANPS